MLKVMKLSPDAMIPVKATPASAGYDLFANESALIHPHTTKRVGTGLAIVPPSGYFCAIFARSGLAAKSGLRPANCVGVCDEDYRGEYVIALHNDTEAVRTINKGDRIAQLVLLPYLNEEVVEVEELDSTVRGAGGFGSTGR